MTARRLLVSVFIAATLLASGTSAQLPEVQRDAEVDRPFVVPPALPLRVLNDAASLGRLPTWVAAVIHHEPGAVDESWRTVASFTTYDLRLVLTACQNGMLPMPAGEPANLYRHGALLHTEIAAAAMRRSRKADVATSAAGSVQFGMASVLVGHLRARDVPDPFARAWYMAVAAFLLSQRELTSTPLFLKQALSAYPSDPQFLVMAGAVCELRASPRVQEATDLGATLEHIGGEGTNLRRAESYYREASRTSPNELEPRVRLARVLGATGRHDEALAELRKADQMLSGGASAEAPVRYFLYLFLGDEEAAANRTDQARAAYNRALTLFHADSAYLSLSRLEHRAGSRAAARAAVENLMPGRRPNEVADPWEAYYSAGEARQLDDLFATLRRMTKGAT